MKAVPEKPSATPQPRHEAVRTPDLDAVAVPERDAVPVAERDGSSSDAAGTEQTATSPASRVPDRRSIQRLQRLAGNGAVSRLVAQRYTTPVKPSPAQSPRFRNVKADVAAKKTRLAAHAPAAAESKASQDAAVAPPDDKEAQGKAANAEKMNAAKPGVFNKKAFIDAVNKAIDAQAPKNLDEADKFSKSGKADQVKAEVDGKVTDGKESSAKDIDTATKAPPDTSAAKDKDVTPLTPDQAPGNPGAPSATDAVPDKQPAAVTDFSEGPAENDKAMADAEVTEEQLAKGNEPEFNEALSAKKTSEADAAKAPAKGKAAEDQQLSTAKQNAAASGAQAMSALTATRATAGKQVDGGKNDTKSKDEKKRAEVTAKLQKVYDGTKKDVEDTLSGLDKKVDSAFTAGEKSARDAFTADHKSRMKKYKDKRYSGLMGKGRWVKDKFAGLPKEADDLYQESRKLYVSKMQTVISSVADIIGAELGKAKARIAKGRTELKAEVDKLPADLRQFGEEAAKDFAGKFDDLEATVNEKSEQLVQDLAQKYTAALNKIDEEIKKLQEANRGLIDKAKDAIVGAIKTINELKNLLLGILAKAASAIMKIIKDPIGFLGNLVKAVGAGLNLFITNIADHLKTGVVSWLLGTAVKAGLDLPQKFDLKGIIQLIGSMLGLTWDNIRTRVTRKGVPDEAMSAVETSVPVAKNLAAEGPAGAVKEIQAEAGDLKATILGKLTTYLIPTVLIAGITWIISLLNPASAFVRAVKGIIDIVTFIVTQGAQIVDFVNAVLDAVIAIANGGQAGVPKLIEAALATSVPLLIGFLAALLGIGGLANKVKSVFQSVSRPVTRAIDKIVDFIAKKGRALWSKLKRRNKGKRKEAERGKNQESITLPKKTFTTDEGEGHLLSFASDRPQSTLMIRSSPMPVHKFLERWSTDIGDEVDPAQRDKQKKAHGDAAAKHAEVKKSQTSLSAASGSDRQRQLSLLVNLLDSLAESLSHHAPGSEAPLPAPVLPPFINDVRATKFTAHYINHGLKGTPSGDHDGNLPGWDHIDSKGLNKGSNKTAWVKMHLLPDFLGGHATDSNLVPARGFTNNPLFLYASENPAKRALKSEEKMIWYRIDKLTFHASPTGQFPDDSFPDTIGVEWGGYKRTQGQWKEKAASGNFSDKQDPPTEDRLRINIEGATAVRKRLGLPDDAASKRIGKAIKAGQPYADITDLTLRWPDFASKFTTLETQGLIRWD
ncbi:phage tail protein [Streptomyces griseus]|uniref:phage tail protein n=1 Tax=Streptomyces griseus TaxID=1911 RepID=UPI0036848D28